MRSLPHLPPTRLRAVERARLIDEAATRLFADQGYAATTVEDVVAAAGVTKPMLYRHYESKQDLCIHLLKRYRDELIGSTLSLVTRDGASEHANPAGAWDHQRLEEMIDAWLQWVEGHPDATRLLFTPIRGDRQVQATQLELFKRQRDTQRALLRKFAPGLTGPELEPLAEITRAGFTAIALWLLAHPTRPRAEARNALLTMARGILTAPRP
jgi:AcrR family transcriptional regulator